MYYNQYKFIELTLNIFPIHRKAFHIKILSWSSSSPVQCKDTFPILIIYQDFPGMIIPYVNIAVPENHLVYVSKYVISFCLQRKETYGINISG